MTDNLKPCPFCGGEAKLSTYYDFYKVHCNSDDCLAGVSVGDAYDGVGKWYGSVAEAIDAWNTRAERTCTNVWDKEPEPKCDNGFKCSLCGYSVSDGEDWRVFTYENEVDDCVPWRYCPGCDAKVVEQ